MSDVMGNSSLRFQAYFTITKISIVIDHNLNPSVQATKSNMFELWGSHGHENPLQPRE